MEEPDGTCVPLHVALSMEVSLGSLSKATMVSEGVQLCRLHTVIVRSADQVVDVACVCNA